MDISSAWAIMVPYIEAMVSEKILSYECYAKVYFYVLKYCTSTDGDGAIRKNIRGEKEFVNNVKGGQLYFKLKEYLTSYCNNLLEQSADLMNEDLLRFYTTNWKKYEYSAQALQKGFGYLNRHWVKKERNMNDISGNEVALEIYNLTIVIWKETIFNKYNTQLVNTAIKLLNRIREGDLVDTTLIQQLVHSYTVMGIYHDGETPSLILYRNQFEKQFLEASEQLYNLKSADFLRNKSIAEYLKMVDKWLQKESDKISIYLDPSTLHILIKTVKRAIIQIHLEELLVGFRELLTLDKTHDLRLVYLLVDRYPEDMGKCFEEFYIFVNSQGLSRIERCGEVVKSDSKMYANAILEVYRKYSSMITTIFNNNLEFKAALNKAFSNILNRNFATQHPNSVRKSSELITKYCDQLMKRSIFFHSNYFDQALEEIMFMYRCITDKDVFQEYYMKLLSKRLLSPEHYDQNSEFLMLSKLKRDSGVAYTLRFERMWWDVVLSKDLSKDFAQNNTEELKIDFNVMVLQCGSWPFRKSPEYAIPSELEKCMYQFTKYYSVKHAGKRLLWMYNLCKGEIVSTCFKNHYIFQCNYMQISILLLFNICTTWSLAQIREQTKIEIELLVEIVKILLKIKIVTCKEPECLTPGSMISLNQFYNNENRRINIGLPLELDDHEQEASNKDIDRERNYLVQTKVIQIMKEHKTLSHRELIARTSEILSVQFEPKVSQIKKTIEYLVEKEYLTRDSVKETYTYLA